MIKTYRLKSAEVEAFQLTPNILDNHILDQHELPFGLLIGNTVYNRQHRAIQAWKLSIETPYGVKEVKLYDYIVRTEHGFLDVFKPKDFQFIYEPIN